MAIIPPFSDFRQRVAATERVAGLAAVRLAELVARSEQLVIDAECSQTESTLSRLGMGHLDSTFVLYILWAGAIVVVALNLKGLLAGIVDVARQPAAPGPSKAHAATSVT